MSPDDERLRAAGAPPTLNGAQTGPAAPSERFRFLDGLRGLAALAVFGFHVSSYTPAPVFEVLRFGWLGVQVFFVLSGFVIAHSIRQVEISPGFLGLFALRRSIRLDPPYWATVALALLSFWVSRRFFGTSVLDPDWWEIVAHVFYLQGVLGARPFVDVFWTLCLEIQLYLVFVILLGGVQRLRGSRIALSPSLGFTLVFAPVALLSVAATGSGYPLAPKAWCLPYVNQFLLGVLACEWRLGRISGRCFAFFVGLVALSLATSARLETGAALTACLAIAAAIRSRGLERWLGSPFFQFWGAISYSFYLTHTLVSARLERLLVRLSVSPGVWVAGIDLVASVCVAWLMYRFVERPSQRLSHGLRSTPSGSSASPAT